jgi:signal transduction histidine kinase
VIEIASKLRYNKVTNTISGIGIKSRDIERIWDVPYRVDPTSFEAGKGIVYIEKPVDFQKF